GEQEQFLAGGSEYAQLQAHLEQLTADIERFAADVPHLAVPRTEADIGPLAAVVNTLQDLADRLGQASAFTGCLVAQHVEDARARIAGAQVRRLAATLEAARSEEHTSALQ